MVKRTGVDARVVKAYLGRYNLVSRTEPLILSQSSAAEAALAMAEATTLQELPVSFIFQIKFMKILCIEYFCAIQGSVSKLT